MRLAYKHESREVRKGGDGSFVGFAETGPKPPPPSFFSFSLVQRALSCVGVHIYGGESIESICGGANMYFLPLSLVSTRLAGIGT